MTVAAHGGDIYQNQITYDFSVNTNPLPLPEILQKRMAEAAVHSNRYPVAGTACSTLWFFNRRSSVWQRSIRIICCDCACTAPEAGGHFGSFFFGICLGSSDSGSRGMQYPVAGRK